MEKQVAEWMESLGLVRRNDGLGWYKEFDHEATIDFPDHIATFFYTELKKREAVLEWHTKHLAKAYNQGWIDCQHPITGDITEDELDKIIAAAAIILY